MKEDKVYKTKSYDKFSVINGNRAIYQPHLARLVKSISKNNLLAFNPIIVNESFEVIDGQHRLRAAETLGVEIYYMISTDAKLSDVQLLNANNRAWSVDDYMKSFIALGKKEYIKLQEFAEEYRISIPIARILLADGLNANDLVVRDFVSGKFAVKNLKKAENLASLLVEIRKYSPDNAWADRNLMRAIDKLVGKVDPKLLLEKLERYSMTVTRRVSQKEYLVEFEEIINFGNKGAVVNLF